jgi:hypothetical protein
MRSPVERVSANSSLMSRVMPGLAEITVERREGPIQEQLAVPDLAEVEIPGGEMNGFFLELFDPFRSHQERANRIASVFLHDRHF